jgi:hypothetical protein
MMSRLDKTVLVVLLAVITVAGLVYGGARYLVSKLNGQGYVPTQSTLTQYSSEDGISFMYPDTYELSSHAGMPGEGDVLVLLPMGAHVPANSEAPPSITMTVARNVAVPLEQWIKTSPLSNFALSSNKQLASTEVGGEPAFEYEHTGLYETDAFAVKHGDKIFLFEGSYNNPADRIHYDFQQLVSSVQFTE